MPIFFDRRWTCESKVFLGGEYVGWSEIYVLSLNYKSVAVIAESSCEAPFDANDGIYRHLSRSPFVISTLPFGRLPFDAELVQSSPRSADETIGSSQYGFSCELGALGAGIDSISKPNQLAFTHQFTQGAEHLVFPAKIREFARPKTQSPFRRDPSFNLFTQCLTAGDDRHLQKLDNYQGPNGP